ncbi:MAG: hypothetical protein WD066_12695 [Planctomycetaceae bacterium]
MCESSRGGRDFRSTARRASGRATGLSLALCLCAAGCFEIDAHVEIHEDGSATITERVQFSQRLLDLDRTRTEGIDIASLLSKESVEARMKNMGEGIRLVSHEVRDAERASRESIAVFEIDDVGKFRYVSPFFAVSEYARHGTIEAEFYASYGSTRWGPPWWDDRSGEMFLRFRHGGRSRERAEDEPPPRPPTPRELQVYRDLQPVFRDMADGMRLKFTVEAYGPVRVRGGIRDSRTRTHKFDLIDFSWQHLDQYGYEFLANEEIMLELLQGELGGGNLVENIKEHRTNATVPVFHPTGTSEISFQPSRALFDKHFAGKKISIRRGRDLVEEPARWEEIGYRPDPNRKPSE